MFLQITASARISSTSQDTSFSYKVRYVCCFLVVNCRAVRANKVLYSGVLPSAIASAGVDHKSNACCGKRANGAVVFLTYVCTVIKESPVKITGKNFVAFHDMLLVCASLPL